MTRPPDQPPRPTSRRRLRLPLFGLLVAPISLAFLLSANSEQPTKRLNLASIAPPFEDASAEQPVETSAPLTVEQRMLGVWEDDYQGHHILTLNDDGTGCMVVELSGAAASLFADRLSFDQEWVFDSDQQFITMTATGGQPQTKVNLVLRIYGREATYRIDDVTEERLVLIDQADEKRYEWRRVEASESGREEPVVSTEEQL